MSVYKPKGSPYFHFDFQLRGRRYHGTTGLENRRDAEKFERQERKRIALAIASTKRPAMTLNAATTRFYQEVSAFQKSEGSQIYRLEYLCDRIGKDTYLADINDNEVADYIRRRRADKRIEGGHPGKKLISNASVNREIQLLRLVMRRAEKIWKVDVGEVPDWPAHLLPEPKGRTRELQDDEEKRLFQHLRQDLHPLARFCILTGVRLSAAIGLRWPQVDFQNSLVTVYLKTHRPEPEAHTIPMTGAMRALLASQRVQHPTHVFTYLCRRTRGSRKKGQRYPYSATGWRMTWVRALKAAGIDDFRFHDLRHTAASRTLRRSRNLKVVQQMLGHADLTSTARYAHVVMDDVRAAMEDTHSRNSPEEATATDPKSLKGKA